MLSAVGITPVRDAELTFTKYTRCDNLIPGMAAVCCCDVQSSKLMYTITFIRFSTCVYMGYKPNETFVPKQKRRYYEMSVVYSWERKMSKKNLEQWLSMEFNVNICKSAGETLAVLTLAYMNML
jgi:hypothetical protein